MSYTVKQLRDALSCLSSDSDDCVVHIAQGTHRRAIYTMTGPYKGELLITLDKALAKQPQRAA